MPTNSKQLLEAANAAVPKISGKEAQEMVAKGAVIVDVRDGTEVAASGRSRAPFTSRAVCSSSRPIRSRRATTRVFPGTGR